jgi:hypothetical protein
MFSSNLSHKKRENKKVYGSGKTMTHRHAEFRFTMFSQNPLISVHTQGKTNEQI